MQNREIVIELNHVNKYYGKAQVLCDVTASFEKGKIYGLIGRNGSGKTVLLKCMCGIICASSGEIKVNGQIVDGKNSIAVNTGVIIESPGFLKNYNGFQNLKFLANLHRKISDQQIKDAIRLVGLDPEDKKHVGKYSLGMRQRLGIAQAIMEGPELLLLDEPFNGLDRSGVESMRELLQQFADSGKTILLASHNAEDIRILCDEVYEIDGGVMTCLNGNES